MLKALSDYPITVEQLVAWGELDPNGHVNNIWYFRYIENARVTLYRQIGKFDQDPENDVTLIIGSTSCRFKQALEFGDTVVVGVGISVIAEDRFTTTYRLVRKKDGAIVAEAEAVSVAFDTRKNVKVPIPQTMRDRIARLGKL